MRLINADKYMERLRADIDSEADIIAEYIKRDTPIGTVKDGGRIGRLQGVQWCRNVLELDYYTVKAIPLDEIKQAREEIENRVIGDRTYVERANVLSILDNLIKRYEVKA